MNFKLLFVIVLCAFVTLGCRSLAPVYNVEEQSIAGNLSFSQVEKGIISGAAMKGWVAKTIKPGHIEASINVRDKHSAKVKIEYSTKSYSIKYLDSKGLKYEDDTIHPNYNKWIHHLTSAINSSLLRI